MKRFCNNWVLCFQRAVKKIKQNSCWNGGVNIFFDPNKIGKYQPWFGVKLKEKQTLKCSSEVVCVAVGEIFRLDPDLPQQCTMGIWAARIYPYLFWRLNWGKGWLIEANWGIAWHFLQILKWLCFDGDIDKRRFFN